MRIFILINRVYTDKSGFIGVRLQRIFGIYTIVESVTIIPGTKTPCYVSESFYCLYSGTAEPLSVPVRLDIWRNVVIFVP